MFETKLSSYRSSLQMLKNNVAIFEHTKNSISMNWTKNSWYQMLGSLWDCWEQQTKWSVPPGDIAHLHPKFKILGIQIIFFTYLTYNLFKVDVELTTHALIQESFPQVLVYITLITFSLPTNITHLLTIMSRRLLIHGSNIIFPFRSPTKVS